MILKEKIWKYLQKRKTPVTAFQIAERFCCQVDSARKAMRQLIRDDLAEPVFVLRTNKFVMAIKRREK
jgi:hypothetical protein